MTNLTEQQQETKFYFTKISSAESDITKRASAVSDDQGNPKLVKEGGGQVWEGQVQVCEVASLDEYVQMMRAKADVPWVAAYGLPVRAGEQFSLITKKKIKFRGTGLADDEITRTKDQFSFAKGKPGFLALDYDPPKFMPDPRDTEILTKEQLRDILWDMMPEWKEHDVQITILDSTTSYLYYQHPDPTEPPIPLKGQGGLRALVPINDAGEIGAVNAEMGRRSWEKGYGRHKINIAGVLIASTILDLCYGNQPERLDFTPAGMECGDGVVQNRPEPLVVGTSVMRWEDINVMTDARREASIKRKITADRKKREQDALPVKEAYISRETEKMVRKNPQLSRTDARAQVRAAYEKRELGQDYLLTIEGYDEPVSVREVMRNPTEYHDKCCFPPTDEDDAEYQRFCARIYSDQDQPVIHSFAHGKCIWKLPIVVNMSADTRKEYIFPFGKKNDEGAHALTEELAKTNEIFSKPGEKSVFVISRDGITSLSATQMEAAITSRYRITEHPGEQAKELSPRNLERIWSRGQILFPSILGISKVPILHKDKTWASRRGYDAESQYFVDRDWKINENPTREETRAALDLITHKVWGEYSFSNPKDSRGVLLSLVLSGFYIPITPIRPGYLITAAERNSGKTLLATTINLLIDDSENMKDLKVKSDNDEMIRMLEADRRKGIRVHIYDNLKDGRSLWDPTLSMILTSPTISHKKLHSNDSIQTKNDILAIFTGNNIVAAQDNARRLFCLYIEKQRNKKFVISPDNFVRRNRGLIIQAVATLINAYRNAGWPEITDDRIGSYGVWDRSVRQNVLWLAKEFPEYHIGDPIENMRRGEADNPDDQNIQTLFWEIEDTMGTEPFTSPMLVEKIILHEELREAMEAFFPGNPKSAGDTNLVANKLKTIKNKSAIFPDGQHLSLLVLDKKKRNRTQYQIVRKHSVAPAVGETGAEPVSNETTNPEAPSEADEHIIISPRRRIKCDDWDWSEAVSDQSPEADEQEPNEKYASPNSPPPEISDESKATIKEIGKSILGEMVAD